MQKELVIKYCNDVGKFLIDVAKLVFGSVFIAPMLKTEDVGFMPLIGIVSSILALICGIILSNLKTK